MVPPTVPGAFLGIPEKGTMKKQKSIGMLCIQCVYVCVLEGMVCVSLSCELQHLVLLACRNILLMLGGLALCAQY